MAFGYVVHQRGVTIIGEQPDLVTPGEWAVQGFAVSGGCPEYPDSICTPVG